MVADAQEPLSYSAVSRYGPLDIKNFHCSYVAVFDRHPFSDFPEDQTSTQIEPPQYPNQNGFEAYALAGTTLAVDNNPDTTLPTKELPWALYEPPAPPSGTTPPPVDAKGDLTPLGLHDQFLWHDLIYAGTQTKQIFQWYDQNHAIPDVPFSKRQNC